MTKIIVDLTHALSPSIPNWDGIGGFNLSITSDYRADEAMSFRVQDICMHAGIGTHIDAPAHCFKGGKTVEAISLDELICPCVVVDVSQMAHENFETTVTHIRDFEKAYGAIQKRAFVIINTGWSKYFYHAERYRNDLQFPTISKNAIEHLLSREISGIGVDTLSPDGPDNGYPVHQTILGAGKYIVENIAHPEKLPPISSTVTILPMNITHATEAPVRMIASFPSPPWRS